MAEHCKSKKLRSANWDEDEKNLLRELILQRLDIIEDKDCSTSTNAKKRAAWQEVLSSFNHLNRKQRDLPQLLNQWRNTKNLSLKANSTSNSTDTEFNNMTEDNMQCETDNNKNNEKKKRPARQLPESGGGLPVGQPTPKRTMRGEYYERQLFLLAKSAREQAMAYVTEEHDLRMRILNLEHQYWEKKINCIKND